MGEIKKVKLGNLAKVLNGYAFKSEDYVDSWYRVIRITNVQKGIIVDDNPKFISLNSKDISRFILNKGDILISLTGNVWRVGVLQQNHLPAVLNQRVGKILITSDKILPEYLFWILNSHEFEIKVIEKSKGIAQKNVGSGDIEEIEIPLPSLEEQKRIVSELDVANALIEKRKQAISHLDEYMKSVFLEMFGDFSKNKWLPLNEISNFIDYRGKTPIKTEQWIQLITAKNVKNGYLEYQPEEFIAEDDYFDWMRRWFPKRWDILFTTEAPLWNAAILPEFSKLAFAQRIIIIQLKESLLISEFFLFVLNTAGVHQDIMSRSTWSTVKGIRSKELKMVKIPLPPICLQNQFAEIIQNTEKTKKIMLAQLEEMEKHFGALMQRSFSM